MPYTPNEWQDRIGIGLNKFTDQNGNDLELTPNPDAITQTGTPFSAAWMNHIEQGIANVGKVLWESPDSTGWSSGSITIPGVSNYTVLIAYGNWWFCILSKVDPDRFDGLGASGVSWSFPQITWLNMPFDGDSLTLRSGYNIMIMGDPDSGQADAGVGFNTISPILKIIGVF